MAESLLDRKALEQLSARLDGSNDPPKEVGTPDLLELDSKAFEQLNSEQKALLDTVDSLRDLGVDEYVDLPQVIVVGNQSSGKSSVLEAISRVRFPASGTLCTRFATELVLRSAPQVKISVSVVKSSEDSASNPDQNRLPFEETSFSRDALPKIIDRAKAHMGIREGSGTAYSKDILRVEISGPELLPLTLVDLPGFFHTETKEQTEEGKAIVNKLAERYMRQSKSIILAVVSAGYDLANQIVLGEAKRHDPHKERTLGIVTKPDLLIPGTTGERHFVQVAKNEETANVLKLGWHVLRNRDERDEGSSHDARDKKEAEFFQSGAWSRVYSKDKGIDELRKKLSKVLVSHIKRSLPSLISDIEKHLAQKREVLARLGKPRCNPSDLRTYMHDIASAFQGLVQDAVRGDYNNKFFGGLYQDTGHAASGDIRKLRATLRNLNRAFDAVLSTKGASHAIQWRGQEVSETSADKTPDFLQPFIELYDVKSPTPVAIDALLLELESIASDNQGVEFPGSPNGDLARMFFRRQAEPWRGIAQSHIDLVLAVTKKFVEIAMEHVVGDDTNTRNAVLVSCVDPFFDTKRAILKEKLDELLRPYNSKYALPLESEFRSRLSSTTVNRLASQVKEHLRLEYPGSFAEPALAKVTDQAVKEAIVVVPDSKAGEFGTEKMVDIVNVYYEVRYSHPPASSPGAILPKIYRPTNLCDWVDVS